MNTDVANDHESRVFGIIRIGIIIDIDAIGRVAGNLDIVDDKVSPGEMDTTGWVIEDRPLFARRAADPDRFIGGAG